MNSLPRVRCVARCARGSSSTSSSTSSSKPHQRTGDPLTSKGKTIWSFISLSNGFCLEGSRLRAYATGKESLGGGEKGPEEILRLKNLLSDKHGVKSEEDFYKITPKILIDLEGGPEIVKSCERDMIRIANILYPEATWFPWRFSKVPNGFWRSRANQVEYLEWLGQRLGYQKREDWYKVSLKDFLDNCGRGFIEIFSQSPVAALQQIFSDFNYKPWLFVRVANNYFDTKENRKEYLDWLLVQVGISNYNDLTADHFVLNHGRGLLMKYDYSPRKVVQSLEDISELSVADVIRSGSAPRHFFDSIPRRREFLDELASKIGLKSGDHTGWYGVTAEDIAHRGGSSLLSRYGYRKSDMLADVYAEFKWEPWRFRKAPNGSQELAEARKVAFRELENLLPIAQPLDWYRVSIDHLKSFDAYKMFRGRGLLVALREFYPDMTWDEKFLVKSTKESDT